MMKNKFSLLKHFFLAAVIICEFGGYAEAASPSVLAESAILINAETGGVIYEKNADTRRTPASLTKIMTCILGLEARGLSGTFKISRAAAATEYSDLGMKGGERMRSGELMRGMMMESDNGASVVVAQNISGTVLNFVERMNAKAKELGCRRTHFSNPHGLTARWHYTTARDMAKIAAYAMKNPDFRRIVGSRNSVIRWELPSGKKYNASNSNDLLKTYSGANGIKTGWTSAAGGCLAASAKRGNVELIAIVLHSPDTRSRFTDAGKLLDYGFSVGGKGKTVNRIRKTEEQKKLPETKKSAPKSVPAVSRPYENKQQAGEVVRNQNNAGTTAVSDKPVLKNKEIRMPVVRKPGA